MAPEDGGRVPALMLPVDGKPRWYVGKTPLLKLGDLCKKWAGRKGLPRRVASPLQSRIDLTHDSSVPKAKIEVI